MNILTEIAKNYGTMLEPGEDINIAEMLNLAAGAETKMEAVQNSYLYGYMRGCAYVNYNALVPVLNIRQMTDDEWQALAARSKQYT